MTEEDNFIDVDKEKEYSEKNLRFRIGGKGERGIKEKMKKKGNKKMEKGLTTISRNPRKPAETYTHAHTHTRTHLSLAWKKLSVSLIERFETWNDSNRFLHFYHLTVFNRLYI